MRASLSNLEEKLAQIRIGRGDPKLFEQLFVPKINTIISEIAEVTAKSSREMIIKPFDVKDREPTMNAINACNLEV